MNKLLAVVTLSLCIAITSTSYLGARSETPVPSTRSHSNSHYQLEQHHSHHNRKLPTTAGRHNRRNTTSTTAVAASAPPKLAMVDSSDNSRTIDGGGGATGGGLFRLRRLSYDESRQHHQAHNYRRSYHRAGRRIGGSGASSSPSNTDWHTRYNINNNVKSLNTNGYGYAEAMPPVIGKDEIMRDVEHINGNDLNNEWLPREEPELVTLPPPTSSTTTTTTTTSTATEGLYGTNLFGRKGISEGRLDPKTLESRHVCVQQRILQVPVKTVEVYTRQVWKHVNHPCPTQTNQSNQMCTRVQLVHEPAYRDVIRHKTAKQMIYECCPGWSRTTKTASACLKPVCGAACRNGGTCTGPDTCSCPPGYGGKYCEKDINECLEEKPCDQLCFNTDGSYYCQCREGFILQPDKQSCKKIENHDDDAFEARDLENEIDSSEVTSRLHKIEKSLANERIAANELQKSLEATYHVVDSLKTRLTTLEKQQHDFNHIQNNLMATESRTRKLENIISVLFKCRNAPGPYCP